MANANVGIPCLYKERHCIIREQGEFRCLIYFDKEKKPSTLWVDVDELTPTDNCSRHKLWTPRDRP